MWPSATSHPLKCAALARAYTSRTWRGVGGLGLWLGLRLGLDVGIAAEGWESLGLCWCWMLMLKLRMVPVSC